MNGWNKVKEQTYPPSLPVPPTIRRREPELWVLENTRVLLSCAAEGVPHPILSWEKEGIAVTDKTGAYTIMSSGELVLENAQVGESRHCAINMFSWHGIDMFSFGTQPEDAGSYTCVATNSVGQDKQTIVLSVYTHPAFTEVLGDTSLNKGERLLLACGATGIPPPKITWAFNSNIIPGEEKKALISHQMWLYYSNSAKQSKSFQDSLRVIPLWIFLQFECV